MDLAIQKRPLRRAVPTSKLTDANNAAEPELSFQRQAVQAFRTRAQEAPSTLKPLVEHTKTPTKSSDSSLTPNVPTPSIDHVDAESLESGGDEDTDSQPKPCMFLFWC